MFVIPDQAFDCQGFKVQKLTGLQDFQDQQDCGLMGGLGSCGREARRDRWVCWINRIVSEAGRAAANRAVKPPDRASAASGV